MKRFRFLFAALLFVLAFAAVNARAQSTYQIMAFSILGEYQTETNETATITNENAQQVLFGTGNIVNALAMDKKGLQWTNWTAKYLMRWINMTNGDEGIFIDGGGTNQLDVSDYFTNASGATYQNDFTQGLSNAVPGLADNFTTDPFLPIVEGTNNTNLRRMGGLHFISITTTNLKLNLVGANLATPTTGILTRYTGPDYTNFVPTETWSVVGTFQWTPSTNVLRKNTKIVNPFYSGPARGTITIEAPRFSSTLTFPPD